MEMYTPHVINKKRYIITQSVSEHPYGQLQKAHLTDQYIFLLISHFLDNNHLSYYFVLYMLSVNRVFFHNSRLIRRIQRNKTRNDSALARTKISLNGS